MKTKRLTLLLPVLFSLFIEAQAPAWEWAKSAEETHSGVVMGVCADVFGDIVMTGGFFSRSIRFGNTYFTNSFTPQHGQSTLDFPGDIFIVKYQNDGDIQWAKKIGGPGWDIGNGIATDAGGNIFVVGSCGNTTKFDTIVVTTSPYPVFIAKLDAAGNFLWVKSPGGDGVIKVSAVSLDKAGNAFVTGYFSGHSIMFEDFTLTNLNDASNFSATDIYIAKYDPAGNVLWAKNAGGAVNANSQNISTDVVGNSVITGYFSTPTLALGSNTFVNSGPVNTTDIFIAKYDAVGKMLWAKSAGGPSIEYASGVSVDGDGNIWVTGSFQSPSITFGDITLMKSNPGDKANMFVTKYDASGNVIWAKRYGGVESSDRTGGNCIHANTRGNAYLAGYVSGSVTMGITDLTKAPQGMVVAKLDPSGNVSYAKSVSSTDVKSICLGQGENVFVAGSFSQQVTFDNAAFLLTPGIESWNLPFVAKLGFGATHPQAISIFPNPFSKQAELFSASPVTEARLIFDNCLGQTVLETGPISLMKGDSYPLFRNDLVAGLYFVRLVEGNKVTATAKILVSD